jgi:hypothetical protein
MQRQYGSGMSTKASSTQIGFVLNTGIMTTFIAVMLVVLSGGFGEEVNTQEELDAVKDEVLSNIIQADGLAQTEGEFTAFFEPPSSGTGYTARIDSTGKMTIIAPDGSLVESDLDKATETVIQVDGSEIEFDQKDKNIVVNGTATKITLDVQEGDTRETGA